MEGKGRERLTFCANLGSLQISVGYRLEPWLERSLLEPEEEVWLIAKVNDVYGSTSAAVLEQCILYEEDFILGLSALGSCTIAEVENALRLIRKKGQRPSGQA